MKLALSRGCRRSFNPASSFVVDLASDATPRLLTFGSLGDRVAEHARYFFKKADGRGWESKTLHDVRQGGFGRFQPRFGVLELPGISCRPRWFDAAGERHDEVLFCPPCVLASNRASSLLSAFNKVLPEFSMFELRIHCARVKLAIIHETFDSGKTNIRPNVSLTATSPQLCPVSFMVWAASPARFLDRSLWRRD
jgi:hypothetical protein